ncbi:pecanex-like protein 4 isoform X2 [Homarus americanus]|nr:pecanex-like protein 4 isoform X2 [Homarus americanus]
MESPLVNDYKKPFIIRRLFETFLGGLRLFASEDTPAYVYILQIILFSVIPLVTVLFVLLEHNDMITLFIAVIINAVVAGLYSLAIQTLALVLRTQKSKKGQIEQVNLASDEDVVEFDSPLGPKTWTFLIREKKLKGGIFIYSLLVGLVGAGVVHYVRPASTYHFNVPWEASLCFTILGLLTVSVGVWPLIGGSPPEPATFHPLSWDLPGLSRPAHMLTCVLIHLISRMYPEMHWLLLLDGLCHVLFALCSLLWLLGILPPIDAYILWILEQWLVVALGGSPMSSSLRLVGQVFWGTLTLFMSAALPHFVVLMVFAAARGFVLSVDIAWMISSLLSPTVKLLTGLSGKYEETHPVSGKRSLRRTTCRRELALFVPMLISVAGMSLGSQLPHYNWYNEVINKTRESNVSQSELPLKPALFQVPAQNTVGGGLLVITTTMLLINEIQKVYFLGIIRNPLFKYHKALQHSNILYIYSQLLHIGCPLVSLILIHQVVSAEVHLQMGAPRYSFTHFILTLPLVRIFRQIWQFPQASFLQLSLYYIIELIRRQSDISMGTWDTLPPATRIFILSIGHLWGTRMINRLTTVILFMITPFTEKKQQHSISFLLLGFNIGISPLLLGLVILSAVISAPLLPVFTLPIFLLGFPRPLRFWSYPVGRSSNSCDDSVYYEQLTPHVVFALHNLLQCGSLGITEPGEHFLLRWEDRFIWVQILECGFTYQYYNVKGLELQETSCHTAEASRVDANFSRAFDGDDVVNKGIISSLFNPHAFHTLTPLSNFSVMGYSDTRNVLTGVIDSPDTLILVKEYFHKALLYVVMNYIVNRSDKVADADTAEESKRPTKSALKNGSQEHLRKLPKVTRRTEYHFEEGFPDTTVELDNNGKERQPPFGRRISISQQSQSQSGRGSRIAWVDDPLAPELIPIVPTGDSSPPSPKWDNEGDPFDISEEETTNIRKRNEKTLPPLQSRAMGSPSSSEDFRGNNRQVNFIPGLMYDSSSEEDEKTNIKIKAIHHRTSAKVNLRMIAQPEVRSPIYESPISTALAPLPNWIVELPFDEEVIDEVQDTFPHAWFKFLLNTFGHSYVDMLDQSSTPSSKTSSSSSSSSKSSEQSSGRVGGEKETYIQRMQYDETLEESYRLLIGTCHLIVLGTDIHAPSPSQVYKTFIGELSWSMALEWLINKQILYELVLHAYRVGVKLALDHILIGGMTGWAELLTIMEDYTHNWYLGPDSRVEVHTHPASRLSSDSPKGKAVHFLETRWPKSWMEAVRMETSNLFSLGYNAVKGVYTSHLLTLGEAEIAVGRLGSETVRGLWASLVAELLYLTNDDDERYSIQAQPGLLRNLTIQAADPPLGYPIFSSPPLRLAVAWLNATFEQVYSSEQEKGRH